MMNISKSFNPPRGSWDPSEQAAAPLAQWMNPALLHQPYWHEGTGKILLGRTEKGQNVAYKDDRHLITIAGSRAGRTATMLIPNLRRYAGSVLVIDPKGELAAHTAVARIAMGQKVYLLDPFGEVEKSGVLEGIIKANTFNPLMELLITTKDKKHMLLGEAASLAESLIVSDAKQPHWGDAARKLAQAVILYLLSEQNTHALTLKTVVDFFASSDIQKEIYTAMSLSDAYDGFLKHVASTNLKRMEASSNEYASIISTGDVQLSPLGDMYNREERQSHSDFFLSDLKQTSDDQTPVTIYLVLPAGKMGSHANWLRMIATLALSALERIKTPKNDGNIPPVLFVLEEFAALGYMRPIERAAGYMAGFGVKLWCILQDLQQLKTHYRNSWQTFLGNAGMLQVFGLNDGTTEEFISQRLGTTQYEDEEPIHHRSFESRSLINPPVKRIGRLLEAHEVRLLFSRETGQQIIIFPQFQPIALMRLAYGS